MYFSSAKQKGIVLAIAGCMCILLSSLHTPHQPQAYNFPELFLFPEMPQNPNNPVSNSGVELGRHLFYETRLSIDSSLSCGSCHLQKFAFSGGSVAFNKGVKGQLQKRNTPPLFNLAWYSKLFWDGRASDIESQVFHPVRDTSEMSLSWTEAVSRIKDDSLYQKLCFETFGTASLDSNLISKAIAQFERTLISTNSKYDRVLRGETYLNKLEYEGFVLMNDQTKGDCLHCHITDANALGTNGKFSNNGLDNFRDYLSYKDKGLGGVSGKSTDYGLFKIPSLRNIAITAPYMHDGRFSTLEEVLDFYSDKVNVSANLDSKMQYAHQGGVHLSNHEKEAIVAFLKTLTDSSFINNIAYSNPNDTDNTFTK